MMVILRIAAFLAGGVALFAMAVAFGWGFPVFCGLAFAWGVLFPVIIGPLPKVEVDYLYYTLGIAGLALFYAFGDLGTQLFAEQRELLASTHRLSVLRGLRDTPDTFLERPDLRGRLMAQINERKNSTTPTGIDPNESVYIFQSTWGIAAEHAKLPFKQVELVYTAQTPIAERQRAIAAVRSSAIEALVLEEAWNAKKTADVSRLSLERDGSQSHYPLAAFWPYLLSLALALKLARTRLLS